RWTTRSQCPVVEVREYSAAHSDTTFENQRALALYDSSAAFRFEIPEADSRHTVQEFQIGGTSARFSKFVIQRGTLECELRKPKGTSNSMILAPLFDLKFLRRTRGTRCRNFKSAALGGCRQPRARLRCDLSAAPSVATSALAVRMRRPSRPGGPTNCAPIGSPPSPANSGSDKAGNPVSVHNVQNTGSPVEPSPLGATPGVAGVRMAS